MDSELDQPGSPTSPEQLLRNNARWAQAMQGRDPWFFRRRLSPARPRFLWISSSHVPSPACEMLGLRAGEVLEHRQPGAVICSSDTYSQALIQFAVEVLQVEHVFVVGHDDCPEVARAFDARQVPAHDEHWISHIHEVATLHAQRLDAEESLAAKHVVLSHLNTIEQAIAVCGAPAVTAAWRRGQSLTVHAWLYGSGDGHLQPLAVSESSERPAEDIREDALRTPWARPRQAGPKPSHSCLTPRETEVLALLAEGISNPSIAQKLRISRNTVASHLRSIYQKLGISDRIPAILAAREMQAAGGFPTLR